MPSVRSVGILKSSAILSVILAFLVMSSQSSFHKMVCVSKARKHPLTQCRRIFKTRTCQLGKTTLDALSSHGQYSTSWNHFNL